jgi:ornithine cyclodeaminase/alanine dehydrogenase-like protein (mu-crystallin family)
MALILSHTVRPLREVRVVNRNDEHYKQLVTSLQAMLGPACPPIHRAPSASEAFSGALRAHVPQLLQLLSFNGTK